MCVFCCCIVFLGCADFCSLDQGEFYFSKFDVLIVKRNVSVGSRRKRSNAEIKLTGKLQQQTSRMPDSNEKFMVGGEEEESGQ